MGAIRGHQMKKFQALRAKVRCTMPAAAGACQVSRRLHFGAVLLVFAMLTNIAAAADSKSATCDRGCLRGFITQYLKAVVAHKPAGLPLADNVRFTEDTVEMKLGESPLWRNASRLRPYRLDILDTRQGVAAAQAIVEEAGAPVMLMLRLRISGRKISEVETQVTRSETEGLLFNIEALKVPNGAMLRTLGDSERISREEAIRIAELYVAGLKAGSFVTVDTPFASDAYRFENGQLMAGPGCTFLQDCTDIKTQKFNAAPEIVARVAAVDEDLGIVLLRMNFGATARSRASGNSLNVWEAFKVYGGRIHAVESFMKNMPLGTPSGWDPPGGK
jgi:hypothetical protein